VMGVIVVMVVMVSVIFETLLCNKIASDSNITAPHSNMTTQHTKDTHTHTHTHTHTYIHTQTPTYIHTHTHTQSLTHRSSTRNHRPSDI
jgi:hypothetical protein